MLLYIPAIPWDALLREAGDTIDALQARYLTAPEAKAVADSPIPTSRWLPWVGGALLLLILRRS